MNVIKESRKALGRLDWSQVDVTIDVLRGSERVFCVGNGGGYAHAMHFASDLRKIAGKQAFSFDNVTEMTARINDDGWVWAWEDWRKTFGYGDHDVTFLFSVGGAVVPGTSDNLRMLSAPLGIVGVSGAAYKRIVVPSSSTPVIEGCQSVIAHHIVNELAP